MAVFAEGAVRARAGHTELVAVHAHAVIEFVAQGVDQQVVAGGLYDTEMKVEIAFRLEIGGALLQFFLLLVALQHLAQFHQVFFRAVLGGKAAGHALECLAHIVEFQQTALGQLDHARAYIDLAFNQTQGFEAHQRFAQAAAAGVKPARQFRLADLGTGGNAPFDNFAAQCEEQAVGQALLGQRALPGFRHAFQGVTRGAEGVVARYSLGHLGAPRQIVDTFIGSRSLNGHISWVNRNSVDNTLTKAMTKGSQRWKSVQTVRTTSQSIPHEDV